MSNSTAIGFGAQVMDSPNTIQLGNTGVSKVITSGVVSATGFVGDGYELTNINTNFSGTVTATGFVGDGSQLTNINSNGGIRRN